MTETTTVNTNQQETTTQPEENGSTGKTFTQEEVNNIVRERLNRVKAAAAEQDSRATDLDKREATLKAREAEAQQRESRAACAEICKAAKCDEAVLDLMDTSNPEKFKQVLDKLMDSAQKVFREEQARLLEKAPKIVHPKFVGPTGFHGGSGPDPIADAFKPKGWN